MKSKELYRQIYKILGSYTPIKADCGELCGSACCKSGDDEELGMYLFPFEEVMYESLPKGFKIEKSDFFVGCDSHAPILFCKGTCNRAKRPLSCRIFPLVPYTKKDNVTVILDKRGKLICPLAKAMYISDLDKGFYRRILYIFNFLNKNEVFHEYLINLSNLIDEWEL